jgi:hypothetical protein
MSLPSSKADPQRDFPNWLVTACLTIILVLVLASIPIIVHVRHLSYWDPLFYLISIVESEIPAQVTVTVLLRLSVYVVQGLLLASAVSAHRQRKRAISIVLFIIFVASLWLGLARQLSGLFIQVCTFLLCLLYKLLRVPLIPSAKWRTTYWLSLGLLAAGVLILAFDQPYVVSPADPVAAEIPTPGAEPASFEELSTFHAGAGDFDRVPGLKLVGPIRIDLTWNGQRWIGHILIDVHQSEKRAPIREGAALSDDPEILFYFQLPHDVHLPLFESAGLECRMTAVSTLVEAGCFLYSPLPVGTMSLRIPLAWEPAYDWTQLGERRMIFFRGGSSDSSLTLRTNIDSTEIAEARPSPIVLLRNMATWDLSKSSVSVNKASSEERLTEITLVDNHTRFVAQQAVTVLAIGAGTLIGLLAQSSAGAKQDTATSGGTNEEKTSGVHEGPNRSERQGSRTLYDITPTRNVREPRRRRTLARAVKLALFVALPIVVVLRKRRRNRR